MSCGIWSVAALVKYLNTHFPDLNAEPNDIIHPKSNRNCTIYGELLMSILDLPDRALTDVPLEMIPTSYDPNLLGDTTRKFLLMFHLKNCLKDITDGEIAFGPKELFSPSGHHTHAVLSTLVAFHDHKRTMEPHIKLILEHQEKRRNELQELKQKVARSEAIGVDAMLSAVRESIQKLESEQRAAHADAKDVIRQADVVNSTTADLERQATRLTESIKNLQIKRDSLKDQKQEMLKPIRDQMSTETKRLAKLTNAIRKKNAENQADWERTVAEKKDFLNRCLNVLEKQ